MSDRTPRPITSAQNTLVRDLRRASQQSVVTDDGYCAIEGLHLIEEAIRSGLRFRDVFFSESGLARNQKLIPQLSAQTELILLPDKIFNGAVSTETPQGVAALVKLKATDLEGVLAAHNALILAAAGVQDPGNFGTMIRSGEAFGATAVIATEQTVSALNPKVIRASAGSLFRLPVLKISASDFVKECHSHGVRVVATSSHKGTPLDRVQLTEAVAIFIGSEGAGVPKDILGKVDETIAIPHSPRVESLNAGIAASILLYEAARQRRIADSNVESAE